MNQGKTPPSIKGQVAQKVGHKCWQATVVLMLSTLAVTHTHTSPEGSRGILGQSRHMTNCSVLLHQNISATRSHRLSSEGCNKIFTFALTQFRYLKNIFDHECNSVVALQMETRQVTVYVSTH